MLCTWAVGSCIEPTTQPAGSALPEQQQQHELQEHSENPANIILAGWLCAGYFDSEEAAAKAWDLAALKHYGLSWKAKLNMPDVTVPLFKQQSLEAAAAPGAGAGGKEAGSAQDSTPAPGARQYRGVQQVRHGDGCCSCSCFALLGWAAYWGRGIVSGLEDSHVCTQPRMERQP